MIEYLSPALLIAVPFLIAIGRIAKNKGMDTKYIPFLLLGIGIAIAIVYGFISSEMEGWRYYVDALFITGVLQGAVTAFAAMGLYDTGKSTTLLKKTEA